jgi:hypothetical protein
VTDCPEFETRPRAFNFFAVPVSRNRAALTRRGFPARLVRLSVRLLHQGTLTMNTIPTKWHAVKVGLQGTSCALATLCRRERFLASEAPALPLPGCDRPETCPCTYRHYTDRREGPRRTDDLPRNSQPEAVERNRRAARGRRTVDSR